MGICIITILFLFSCSSKVDAKAPNVIDCLEDKTGCEEDVDGGSTPTEQTSDDTNNSGSLLFSIIKTVLALLLIIVLIYLLLRFLNKRNKLFNQVKSLENLGGISVGQNKSIQVVRIGSKVFLVGVGDNVQMLQELTDEEVKNGFLTRNENDDSNQFSASNILPPFLKPKTNGENHESNFKHLFSEELKKLKQNRVNIIKQHKQKEDKHE